MIVADETVRGKMDTIFEILCLIKNIYCNILILIFHL